MNLIFHDLLSIIVEVYIDDIVVKSASLDSHLVDLRLAFEKMRRYGLKMNPLKCAFGVSAGKFLGFIVHEKGVEIDPKKIELIKKVQAPTCKEELQRFLGKVNYLRRFICNLSGKVDAFTPLLRLESGAEFTWGAKQQEAFDEIKSVLTSPPVLQVPKSGVPFWLYVAAEPSVIGAVLTQETNDKEYVVAYESRRFLDTETRYTFIEKICLSLYYACTKLRHYLLSSTCYVACQTDIIKYMLQKPILSGRVGKWAYALVEYDLRCEPIRSMRGQIVDNFIVQYRIDKQLDLDVDYVTLTPWKLHFDGSTCRSGCGVGIIIMSPSGAILEALSRLDHKCTYNQMEYEALLFGLQILHDMGVKHVEAYDDSLLVVQQVSKVCQCLNGSLNAYLDKCLDIISCMDEFVIYHVTREENPKANALAQQASGYNVQKKILGTKTDV
jgi:ribonuclease HI